MSKETTNLAAATPVIITFDNQTFLAYVNEAVVSSAYKVAANTQNVSREEMFDFLEMNTIGALPTYNLNPSKSFVTRDMSEAEILNWNIVKATYARAETVKDGYLTVHTVNAIKGLVG